MYSKEEIAKRANELEEHLLEYAQRDKSYQDAYLTLKDVLQKAKQGKIYSPVTLWPFDRMMSERKGWLQDLSSSVLYVNFKTSLDVFTQEEREAITKKRMEGYERRKKLREQEGKT